MAEYVNTDAIVRNRIQYAKDFNYFKKLFILQKLTREEYARFLDALHKKISWIYGLLHFHFF